MATGPTHVVNGLAPVATGPAGSAAIPPAGVMTIGPENRDQTIGLYAKKTLTVNLPSSGRDEYSWRFSQIPDPTVLKLVSKHFTPNADPRKAGVETLVFEGTGPGEVNVKMWYGTLWASPMDEAYIYQFTAAVSPEESKNEKKKSKTHKHPTNS